MSEENSNTKITVADYIADFFVEKNIKHIFGYQGGAVSKIIDCLVATGKVEYIQNYNEQASGFCADSYSRVNHDIGVAIATSGPGATNLVTGIANAQMDSIPTLFITGQDHLKHVSRDNGARLNGFQDLDIVSIVKPITKYAVLVTKAEEIKYELEKCYSLAKSGRPGAVLIDIPIDIQFAEIESDELKSYTPEETPEYEFGKISEVIGLIKKAKRPLILAGGGIQISNSSDELKKFTEITNIPVVTTLNGSDAVEGNYSFAGLHGNVYSNIIVKNADLIIALGARFGQQQVGKATEKYTLAKIVHVDLDKPEFDRIMSSTLNIHAPLDEFLKQANQDVKSEKLPDFNGWHKQASKWKDEYEDTCEINEEGLKPVIFTKKLINTLPKNAIVCSDVGQNQMWVAQAFKKRGKMRLLNSSGLGSMGYSLPASIGARYSNSDVQVISCTGDGGLSMSLQELILVGHRQLNIKVIVYNNNVLGMMKDGQRRYYDSNFLGSTNKEYTSVNLEKAADTFGLDYLKIEKEEEFDSILPFLKNNKPCIIELVISEDSRVSNRHEEEDIINANLINN